MTQPATLPAAALSPLGANLICMASMFVWAAALPAADLLIGKVPPLPLTAARMVLAAAVLLPLWALVEGAQALRQAPWGRGALIGGGTIGAGAVALVLAQGMTDAVTVAVIAASMPVVGLALEVALDGRKITLGLILGLALSLAGGVVALGDRLGALSFGLGAALAFASTVTFTLGSRLTVTQFPAMTPLGRTTVTLGGASVLLAVVAGLAAALGAPGPDWAVLGWAEFGALALFGIGGLAVSQVLWILSVGHLGIGVASLHINAAPFYVMAILAALGGTWDGGQALGAALVAAGVLVAQGVGLRRKPAVV